MNTRSLLYLCMMALMALAASVLPSQTNAERYPHRPIRFIVPYSPGGGADIVARLLAQKLSESFSERVVVDNRPGAGGILGTDLGAKTTPDGYTLVLGNVGPVAISPSLYKKLPYDPLKDLAPVSLLVTYPNVLVINASLPVNSLKEFIAFAKARPRQLTYASAGIGSSTHLAAELLFKSLAGIEMTHVPYKDVGQAFIDILTGRVHAYLGSPLRALPFVRSGKLRALAVTTTKRIRAFPDWPTVAESGFPGYAAFNWLGLLVPAGTPAAVVSRLNQEVITIFQQPEVQEQVVANGGEIQTNSAEEFAEFIRIETKKWAKVVKDSGAKVE